MTSWVDTAARSVEASVQPATQLRTTVQLPEIELLLLSHLAPMVPERVAIDIGSFDGAFIDSFRSYGFQTLAFEPTPGLAAALRAKWRGDPLVRIEAIALSDENGSVDLHLGHWLRDADRELNPGDAFNTLEARDENAYLCFPRALTVVRRQYKSLVQARLAPSKAGIMKIDTEGHDIAVLGGAWPYIGRITVCEYWSRDFLFSNGKAKNDIADYRDFWSRHSATQALVVGRDASNLNFFYQLNPEKSYPNSWGSILFTSDTTLLAEAVSWCERILGGHNAQI
jgi:FkbM family methyltransferase